AGIIALLVVGSVVVVVIGVCIAVCVCCCNACRSTTTTTHCVQQTSGSPTVVVSQSSQQQSVAQPYHASGIQMAPSVTPGFGYTPTAASNPMAEYPPPYAQGGMVDPKY
ncbi:uncharacterized protein LOC102809676, partial [Saccoglossus kowalevskii]|uniref:Uncharacterized protein LOC102809676 n=1 Tax=Saccoglossus kowalevskii TaxID=10224 RepID=A0ABM0N087_SACKO